MANGTYGTPMGMGTQPMGMGMATSGVRNMNLPMSSARPIEVDENTPNLEEIQGFPVAGTAADGTHFHQDPITGQMYRMSTDLHQRIPQIILNNRLKIQENASSGISNISNGIPRNNTDIGNNFNYFGNPIPVNTDVFLESLNQNDLLYDFSSLTILNYKNRTSTNPLNTSFTSLSGVNDLMDLFINEDYEQFQKRPINVINNQSFGILETNNFIGKYISINRFINQTNFNEATTIGLNYYIPINRFNNR